MPVSSSGHLVLVPALLGWPYGELDAELRKAFEVPAIKDAWARQGSEIPTLAGPEFGTFVNAEIGRWAALVKEAGIKMEEPAR